MSTRPGIEPAEPATETPSEPAAPLVPTRIEELGVLGAQGAAEQEKRLSTGSGAPMSGFEQRALRERLLSLAQSAPSDGIVSANDVVARAETYLKFIQGGTDG